jgi:hypothetical protein
MLKVSQREDVRLQRAPFDTAKDSGDDILHPNHLELRKMAHVLAPPRVINADILPAPSVRANQAWLRDHADEYKGQWVALQEGVLLAAGATAREVWDCLENTNGIMITKVF